LKTTNVRIPDQTYESLRKMAYEMHISQNAIILKSIEEYLEKSGYAIANTEEQEEEIEEIEENGLSTRG